MQFGAGLLCTAGRVCPVAVKAVSSLAVPPARLSTPQMGLPPSVMQKIHEALPLVEKHSDIKVDTECCHLMNSMQAGVYVQCMSMCTCMHCTRVRALWVLYTHATLTRFRHLLARQMRPSCTQPSRFSLGQGQGVTWSALQCMQCITRLYIAGGAEQLLPVAH